jgi:Leucine-rich repeat (LRR) protein
MNHPLLLTEAIENQYSNIREAFLLRLNKFLLSGLVLAALTGCKIQVVGPDNGAIVSEAGSFRCEAKEICNINVSDVFFDETFHVEADEGFYFKRWVKRDRGMCGGKSSPCHLFTTTFPLFELLLPWLANDERFYLEAEMAIPPQHWQPIENAIDSVRDSRLKFCLLRSTKYLNYAEELEALTCDIRPMYGDPGAVSGVQRFAGIESFTSLESLEAVVVLSAEMGPLSHLAASLTTLHLNARFIMPGIDTTADFLGGMANLKSLELNYFTVRNNFDIAQLTKLEHLSLRGNRNGDIAITLPRFHKLTKLKSLDISRTFLSNIGPLEQLPSLTIVDLSLNGLDDEDVIALSQYTDLRELNISSNQIQDISPLSGLTQLESFKASGNQITDISVVAHFPNLHSLAVVENTIVGPVPIVTDFSPIAGLHKLKLLQLSGLTFEQSNLLNGFPNLETLWLDISPGIDVSLIAKMTKLKELSLSSGILSDLSFLSNLISLESLHLSRNRIVDFSPLSGLKNLTTLSLGVNSLVPQDLSPLAKLTSLEALYLGGNAITDISPLSSLIHLTELNLRDNQVEFLNGGLDGMQIGFVDLDYNPILCSVVNEFNNNSGDPNNPNGRSPVFISATACIE